MKNRDFLSSLFWIGFGILFVIGALQQGLVRKGIPGPGFLPFISGLALIFLSFLVLIPAFGKKDQGRLPKGKINLFPEKDSLKKILFALLGLIAYGISLEYGGYLLTTFLFMVFIPRLIAPPKWRAILIVAFSTTILSYLLFVTFLEVSLPKGILGI